MALARGILAALLLAALPAKASIPELDQAPLLGPSTTELVDAVQSEAEPRPAAPATPRAAASFQMRIVAPSDWPFGGPQHPCVKRDPLRVRLWSSTCVMGYPVRPFWPVGPENRVIGIFSASSLQVYENQQFSAQTAVDRSEDDFDRMTVLTDRWGNQIRYSYDANGNRVQLTDPQSKVTRYTFDALNRFSTVVIPEAGITEY